MKSELQTIRDYRAQIKARIECGCLKRECVIHGPCDMADALLFSAPHTLEPTSPPNLIDEGEKEIREAMKLRRLERIEKGFASAIEVAQYWKTLANEIATVWWWCHNNNANLQHGDLEKSPAFSICLLGREDAPNTFHGNTPVEAMKKADAHINRAKNEPAISTLQILSVCDFCPGRSAIDKAAWGAAFPPGEPQPPRESQAFYQLAEHLHEIGWTARNDAQWLNLEKTMPKVCEIVSSLIFGSDNAISAVQQLEAAGMGAEGKPNTLRGMVEEIIAAYKDAKVEALKHEQRASDYAESAAMTDYETGELLKHLKITLTAAQTPYGAIKDAFDTLKEKLDDISEALPEPFTAHKRADITGISLLDDVRGILKELALTQVQANSYSQNLREGMKEVNEMNAKFQELNNTALSYAKAYHAEREKLALLRQQLTTLAKKGGQD